MLPIEEYEEMFARSGGTDVGYLRAHYQRFVTTKALFEATWPAREGHVLDVGAHWLHQAMLYRLDGYRVTAADFASTIETAPVRNLATAHGVDLLTYADLSSGRAFDVLPDDSVDVVLFTEIIEHITFNPVRMWRELHRVLRPGGRLVVTTPNYYALSGRLWNAPRLLRRLGGGLPVDEIIRTPTFGHHWKEYSLRELARYFRLLSPDFVIHKALYVEDYYPLRPGRRYAALAKFLERRVRLFRPNLHVEIALPDKSSGVVGDPSW